MKKISIIVMALAFLAALTQCKKEQAIPANDSEGVAITLDIKGNGGTRVDVNTGTGAVTYQNGDVIYVASGGKYVGTLTYGGTCFAGTITDPVVGEPLHFYFLGNVTPAEILTAGTTQTCSVVISDQTQRLPVIEYAPSVENYTSGANKFTAELLNKCALVKFNVTTPSNSPICITGMKNKVTVDFSQNTVAPSMEGEGVIKLPGGGGENIEKWAILLPQDALGAGAEGSAYSEDGVYTGTRGDVPTIYENGYLTLGIEVNLSTADLLATPLTLEALENGTIVVNIMSIEGGKGGGVYPGSSKGGPGGGRSSNISMKYSVNNGERTLITTDNTTIDVAAGDRVQLYSNGPDLSNLYVPNIAGGTAQVKVYGNIMSMLDEDNYATLTTLQDYAFYSLFGENVNLTDASGLLLPATTLTEGCYSSMFLYCTSLTTAPTLPATTLAEGCYNYMFSDCTSLTTAPALPATTLDTECYYGMFSSCTNLTTAPALPATTLAESCYGSMFYGCTSLTTAPTLPATTLAKSCYRGMFSGCTSLNSITCLATEGINENKSTTDWVNGVASTGTFNRASSATWPTGSNGIPSGWTVNEQ